MRMPKRKTDGDLKMTQEAVSDIEKRREGSKRPCRQD